MTTNQFSCLTINEVEEISFIGGTAFTIVQTAYDASSSPIDLTYGTNYLVISTYGQPNNVVATISGSVSGSVTNQVTYLIDSSLSGSLSGLYLQQAVNYDVNGTEFRPEQGLLMVKPRNAA